MMQFFDLPLLKQRLQRCCPTLLLDAAQQMDENLYEAVKAVSMNEEFFIGHFPGHPIMPGVLQIEAMKQLCELAAQPVFNPDCKTDVDIHLALLAKAKFRRPVTPGDRLKITAEILERQENSILFKGIVATEAGIHCEALLTLKPRNVISALSLPATDKEFDKQLNVPVMDTVAMMSMMPHRYPFLFIDYISKIDGSLAYAVKNITNNDSFFMRFQASCPMVPESLLCEMVAQSGAAAVLSRPENAGKIGVFMSIEKAEAFAPIIPGDQLVLKVDLPGKGKFGKGPGEIYVNGEKRFAMNMMFAIVSA